MYAVDFNEQEPFSPEISKLGISTSNLSAKSHSIVFAVYYKHIEDRKFKNVAENRTTKQWPFAFSASLATQSSPLRQIVCKQRQLHPHANQIPTNVSRLPWSYQCSMKSLWSFRLEDTVCSIRSIPCRIEEQRVWKNWNLKDTVSKGNWNYTYGMDSMDSLCTKERWNVPSSVDCRKFNRVSNWDSYLML